MLLDSGLVATSAGCCCGGCSDCCFQEGVSVPFDDGMGGCWLSLDCHNVFSIPVACDTLWRTQTTTCCCPEPIGSCTQCGETCVQTVDPDTCVFTDNCASMGITCSGCGATTVLSDQCFICGACCVGTTCSSQSEPDCLGMGGIWLGALTDCVGNPCD